MQTAVFDPALAFRVAARRPLLYREGADPAEDRPAFVRAASGIASFGGRLAIVQDDARFVAIVEGSGDVRAIALPRGEEGMRLFDERRGNKRHKLDLEACVVAGDRLVAFGSGSTPARDRIVTMDASGAVSVIDARAFYDRLRARADFAGSEMNVEGAAVLGDRLVLASRGNGSARDGREPVDALGTIDLAAFLAYVADPSRVAAPTLSSVRAFALGHARDVRLTFTDLTAWADRILYVACAEASPDTYRDGEVVGVAIGIVDGDGAPRQALVHDEEGRPLVAKIEGLVVDGGRLRAVIDVDDPDRPAELLEIEATLGQ